MHRGVEIVRDAVVVALAIAGIVAAGCLVISFYVERRLDEPGDHPSARQFREARKLSEREIHLRDETLRTIRSDDEELNADRDRGADFDDLPAGVVPTVD